MGRYKPPLGFHIQSYRFEVDRPSRHPAIVSHQGARRFAWNWALGVIEEQLYGREAFRLLAIRQGASLTEAEKWAESACTIPYLVQMNEKRKKDHEAKVVSGELSTFYQPVSDWCPWSAEAMRYVWNREKHDVAFWWKGRGLSRAASSTVLQVLLVWSRALASGVVVSVVKDLLCLPSEKGETSPLGSRV